MHWVFAYGSNMHLPDLGRWLEEAGLADRAPSRVAVASIHGFALAWNYRSVVRGGGAANAIAREGGVLRGLVLRVDDRLLEALDAKEGHPTRYDRGEAPVAAELVDTGERVGAWLYRVTPEYEVPGFAAPRRAYLDLIIEAAEEHALGGDYVASLRTIPVED